MFRAPHPPTENARLLLEHRGDQPVSQVQIAGDGATYSFGSVSWSDVVRGLLGSAEPSVSGLRRIWSVVGRQFAHLCDNGSPLDHVWETESSLQRYYSYSFGSCRDINLMLASALTAAGFHCRPLRSSEHVAIQVETPDGPYYVDADLNVMERGDIAELIRRGREPFVLFKDCPPRPNSPLSLNGIHWQLWPGDIVAFTLRRPRLLFRPLNRADPYNIEGVDIYHRVAACDTRVGEAWLSMPPRVVRRGTTPPALDVEVQFPCVLLGAELTGLPADSRVSLLAPSQDGFTEREFSWAPPIFRSHAVRWLTGTIAPSDMLSNWGGHARRAYLGSLEGHIVTDSNAPAGEVRRDLWLRLFEDGQELGPMVHGPDPAGAHRNQHQNRIVIERGMGAYRLYQKSHLVFSSTDGSDPVTNGRRYWYRVQDSGPHATIRGRYNFRFRIHDVDALSPDWRIHLRFQYNRAVMPTWSSAHLVGHTSRVTLSCSGNHNEPCLTTAHQRRDHSSAAA